jgi:hypothetical protein
MRLIQTSTCARVPTDASLPEAAQMRRRQAAAVRDRLHASSGLTVTRTIRAMCNSRLPVRSQRARRSLAHLPPQLFPARLIFVSLLLDVVSVIQNSRVAGDRYGGIILGQCARLPASADPAGEVVVKLRCLAGVRRVACQQSFRMTRRHVNPRGAAGSSSPSMTCTTLPVWLSKTFSSS